jgi:hypothetical protein
MQWTPQNLAQALNDGDAGAVELGVQMQMQIQM